MHHAIIHTAFDLLAVTLAVLGGWVVYKWRLRDQLEKTAASVSSGYFIALSIGSIGGAFLFGTLNLYLMGLPTIGRSVLGSLFGAIMMVELYKLKRGTKGSTGYIYIVPFCLCIAVGRLGCFFSGIEDQTHGIPTGLPWAHDFGDGILRHPVQLYESFSMLAFTAFTLLALKNHKDLIIRYGFYLCAGFYATQRFAWEFLKPYHQLGPLNMFQYICIALIIYSSIMIYGARHAHRTA
ncbi:MAG: prolipoprotein diacylglyceryl transferase [Alphaproteobacteria bacterium]